MPLGPAWSAPAQSLQNRMHYRFYTSSMGRFMRPDNVSGNPMDPQTWNLYSYVRGNPVNFNDPTGHGAFDAEGPHPLQGTTDPFRGPWINLLTSLNPGETVSTRTYELGLDRPTSAPQPQQGRPIVAFGQDYSFTFNPPAPPQGAGSTAKGDWALISGRNLSVTGVAHGLSATIGYQWCADSRGNLALYGYIGVGAGGPVSLSVGREIGLLRGNGQITLQGVGYQAGGSYTYPLVPGIGLGGTLEWTGQLGAYKGPSVTFGVGAGSPAEGHFLMTMTPPPLISVHAADHPLVYFLLGFLAAQ